MVGTIADHLQHGLCHLGDILIILDQQNGAPASHVALTAWRHEVSCHGCRTGQIERHRGPFADLALDRRHAARLLSEAIDLAETKAGTFADILGGDEWFEHPLTMVCAMPDSGT